MPHLYVNVSAPIKSGLCIYLIDVELNESIKLERGFITEGTIWRQNRYGTVGSSKIRDLREDIGDKIDLFINDYLAANSKK
jgi:hypothetical protein